MEITKIYYNDGYLDYYVALDKNHCECELRPKVFIVKKSDVIGQNLRSLSKQI